jgi:cell division septation protein DedD
MAENRKGKGLFYLGRGQIVIIAVGFTVTSVVIFFLGIMVGQGIAEKKMVKGEEPLVKIPVQPLSSGSNSEAPAKEEMTFYDTLAKAPTEGGKKTSPRPEGVKTSEKAVKRVAKAEPPAPAQRAQEKKETETRPGKWSVQVNAYLDERDAQDLVKKLSDKGYDAYVVTTNIKGRTWYRVRVGRLATQQEAKNLQQTLMTKERFAKAFATSK